jgi:hypothetical protein
MGTCQNSSDNGGIGEEGSCLAYWLISARLILENPLPFFLDCRILGLSFLAFQQRFVISDSR